MQDGHRVVGRRERADRLLVLLSTDENLAQCIGQLAEEGGCLSDDVLGIDAQASHSRGRGGGDGQDIQSLDVSNQAVVDVEVLLKTAEVQTRGCQCLRRWWQAMETDLVRFVRATERVLSTKPTALVRSGVLRSVWWERNESRSSGMETSMRKW